MIALAAGFVCSAQAQTLTLADRQASKTFALQVLLADPAVRQVTIAEDPVYHRSMTYRAIPMADFLKGLTIGDDDYVQARAVDNFSVSIPARLLKGGAGSDARAYLAIDDPASPWPPLPGKADGKSAGPFSIVWQIGGKADVSSEYWAYQLVALTVTDSPFKRWPGLAVADSVPAADPIRRGLDRFVVVCMACHRFGGAGEADQGPDLAVPMNPVDYFKPEALRKLLRDPASVRTWPEQKMPAFGPDTLPDDDIDAIVAWLAYKARERK
ncbi:cytochrome c [Enhydrobacter aerosaccus]|uniref:cytochrome c n=1 Tax=Enhydrobacter aerosaccus TaxID=225324 RepID=UPI001116C8B6|nr:cytochrome c [Enhydrobacter aerosaccus]